MDTSRFSWRKIGLAAVLAGAMASSALGEAMLQYFNTSWKEITDRMPELAEAGYSSLWLPPPTKGSGGLSVGYDLWDPFDLGGRHQRSTVATRYGTEAELLNLVETAHRFGIRVYFDNIMNHRAFDIPAYNESTPADVYPGMAPEDFHLRRTQDGFYRKWDNCRDWNDAWQVLHLGLSDLIDIAHESPNQNHGAKEGDWHPKPSFVRHPDHPEFYDRMPNTNQPPEYSDPWDWSSGTSSNVYVGFGTNNGITAELIAQYPAFYSEDVGGYLMRAARWLMDRTRADGLRLDAVKHVPDYFFGEFGADASHLGYCGNVQWQFNMTRGFSDWDNHRDSNFNTEIPRDDAILFGEHLGQPPGYDGYISAGMRLVDNDLRNELNWRFSANNLWGFDNAGAGGFAPNVGVMHAQSHDNDFVDRKEAHHAYYFLRGGLGLLYTDGNHHAETLGESGGAFPRWANTAFLGQWGQTHIPELLKIHENFARYDHIGYGTHWDGASIAWERGGTFPSNTMLVVFNSRWEDWLTVPTEGSYPDDIYLYNYAQTYPCYFKDSGPRADYVYASDIYNVNQPPHSYSVWGIKNPDPSSLWPGGVISIYDDGALADTVAVERKDGPDGDAEFNPYGHLNRGYPEGVEPAPYSYRQTLPRITKGSNVVFTARVDGSADNVLMRLNGGMDLNGANHAGGDPRDNPPALSHDMYLGFENVNFVQRIWPEKFAASNTINCQIGTPGATSYQVTIGQSNATNFPSSVINDYGTVHGELSWVYHDPLAMTDVEASGGGGGVSNVFGPVTYATANTSDFTASGNAGHFNAGGQAAPALGGNPFGLWANSGGLADYVCAFTQNVAVDQSIRFDYQNSGVDETGASIGWQLRDVSNNDLLTLAFNQGDSNYRFHQGASTTDTGIGWRNTAQTADIEFTSSTNVAVTLNGTNLFNFTLSTPVRKIRFWNYTAGPGSDCNYYFNNIRITEPGVAPPPSGVTNQYYLTTTSVVVYAKTPKQGGTVASLYYTTDGANWPEGAGGAGAFRATKAVDGVWTHAGTGGSTDWWKFEFPKPSNGTILRYKIGAARRQGADGSGTDWEIVWPGSADAIYKKHIMLGEWNTDAQNLKTKSYHKHNDYNSWTTNGLKDGFHLITVRAFLNRSDGAPVFNTFKQPFYLDTETPQGYIEWPANNGDTLTGSEYGVVVRTDPTVREVWYRIEDADASNDSTNNANGLGDIWQQAQATTPSDMNVDYPQAWRFNYANIAGGNSNATIRVRLREWSSAPRSAWSNESLTAAEGHFTELVRTVKADGTAYRIYFDWPGQDGELVEAGWEIRVKYHWEFAQGLDDAGALALFTIKFNSVENGGDPANGEILSHEDIEISHHWDYPHENTISFKMPNVYNGRPDWLHSFQIIGQRDGKPTIMATRKVKTRGELLPSIIIAEPPEMGSDGKLHVIILEDVPTPVLATNPALRTTQIRLQTGTNAVETGLYFTSPSGYVGEFAATATNTVGTTVHWDYAWSNLTAGTYRFTAWARDGQGKTNTASRTVRLQLLQVVDMSDPSDLDHDDDGMLDEWETTPAPLPPKNKPNPESWTNADVHAHYAFGRSLPHSPDSDGDGLPDALELGFRVPTSHTDTNADTNADGWPNFLPDLDPPFYNTLDNYDRVPGVDSQSKGGDRGRLVRGSTTDPSNPDSDYDGIPDGIEDANRNGWVDGDGEPIEANWEPWLGRDWPTGKWNTNWKETDPNNPDTDGDGLSDGHGEDKNFNGYVDIGLVDGSGNVTSVLANASVPKVGGAFSRKIDRDALFAAYPNAVYLETDPLVPDTDGDGLPDGWEVRYGLDPLEGNPGTCSLRTGLLVTNAVNGAEGDPDGDGFSNLQELINGTNPRVFDDPGQPPAAHAITIGPGPALGSINGVTNYQEFTDWTLDDLIALDPYNDGGSQAVDIYRRWDGYDSSRDMVAFYMRDGGAEDNKMYFRVDFADLKAYAEEGFLDVYVVIDFNSPEAGEAALPDEVDTRTDMKWEAVVAVYDSQNGRVLVDTDASKNTLTAWDDLAANGVIEAPGAYLGAYFNSELDAVEFAIDRNALTSIGWNGIADNLNFQVFTTKDGTCNSCNDGKPGAGDIGGRSDITDTIRTDWICSDYWRDQGWIAQNGVLTQYIGKNADNNRGQSAKIALLSHGNQAIQPGSYVHDFVNNGASAGYHRPIQIHGIYQAPLNLHITPTLAMALEWADVNPDGAAWRSGVALNELIRSLVSSNVITLMGSTYSDHILPYFTPEYNADNVQFASETLNRIYGANINSNSVFWTPERVLDADVFAKITNMGFRYTLVDQNTHIWNWYGRQVALGDDGYRINRINGVNAFVINNAADDYRFANHDQGLSIPLRELFSRRSRSGNQNQVATIFCMWEEFNSLEQADAYDRNLRWLANHPWTQLVSLEDIAAGEVALPWGQSWDPVDRGDTAGGKQSHNWINHANNENYDNWYDGSERHEGLKNKKFLTRPGVTNANVYGALSTGGLVSNAWSMVKGIAHPDVKRLAREVFHASVFETAFHAEDNNDLSRWAAGGYIYPATGYQLLIDFAQNAQSQTRFAAIYSWLDTWAAIAGGLSGTVATSLDVDLDGEVEYLLYNRHVAAVFERIGGRMIAAWQRTADGRVYQMIGNLAAYSGSATEEEGAYSVETNGVVVAHRTSALKDWWADTPNYVNSLYTVTTNGVVNGLKLTSGDSKIIKTVTLAPTATAFAVQYAMTTPNGVLYVRNGFSPNLSELLVRGQRGLSETITTTGGVVALTTELDHVGVELAMTQGFVNTNATDDNGLGFDSLPMRNQAQTRQIEMVGTNSMAFTLGFFAEEAANEPPVISFDPEVPYTAPVGTTNIFTVSATDPNGDPVVLGSGPLPFTATFDTASGVFAWWVTNMGSAGTTNVVAFTADDGYGAVTNTATIVVPWDANGNEIPDDWEFRWFNGDMTQTKDGDADGDGFSNYAEWVASTDPLAEGSYIGWETQFVRSSNTVDLTFQSIPGRRYHIEGNDGDLPDPAQWKYLGFVHSTSTNTAWTDTNAVPPVRHYRIKIPAAGP